MKCCTQEHNNAVFEHGIDIKTDLKTWVHLTSSTDEINLSFPLVSFQMHCWCWHSRVTSKSISTISNPDRQQKQVTEIEVWKTDRAWMGLRFLFSSPAVNSRVWVESHEQTGRASLRLCVPVSVCCCLSLCSRGVSPCSAPPSRPLHLYW